MHRHAQQWKMKDCDNITVYGLLDAVNNVSPTHRYVSGFYDDSLFSRHLIASSWWMCALGHPSYHFLGIPDGFLLENHNRCQKHLHLKTEHMYFKSHWRLPHLMANIQSCICYRCRLLQRIGLECFLSPQWKGIGIKKRTKSHLLHIFSDIIVMELLLIVLDWLKLHIFSHKIIIKKTLILLCVRRCVKEIISTKVFFFFNPSLDITVMGISS